MIPPDLPKRLCEAPRDQKMDQLQAGRRPLTWRTGLRGLDSCIVGTGAMVRIQSCAIAAEGCAPPIP